MAGLLIGAAAVKVVSEDFGGRIQNSWIGLLIVGVLFFFGILWRRRFKRTSH